MSRRVTPIRRALEPQRAEPSIVIVGAVADDAATFERVARLLATLLDGPAKE